MILASLVIGFMVRKDLPFSKKASSAAESQRGMTGVLLFLLPASIGGIHYGLTLIPYAVPVALVIVLGIVFAAMKLYGADNLGHDFMSP